ncbi:phosphoglycolate phosphatase [Sulfurivirga caldicuralii]|uniref:Phosphoglycolate phosphatase n=1 Tax=Sulfurivirga caldicuralii TaxID=364032 RepID=A0A1N6GV53_9GAMM|nr:phosphoglycolate phosphatase [Sulfurivirga caldicuralii]SIO11440.1 phosphoglycolate phosphatase [Sulfurivirga caldicuralii]
MEKMRPDFVLIDLDGTLIDSVPDLAYCVDEMMKRLDMPVRGEASVRNWVGNGVERLVQRALINAIDGEPDPELYARALPIFKELYAENTSQRSVVYPGVKEGLDWLKANDYRIGCVTNKAEAFTIPLLKDKGLYDYFEVVVSGDTCSKKKPDPEPLLYAAKQMGVAPDHALMIGDSKSDVKAARAAGFRIFCVPYGYNHGEDIRAYEPDVVIDSFADLPKYLKAKGEA